MIRLLLRLFRIRDFEPNETIAILKEQLAYERSEKDKLTETLLNILQPKVVEASPVMLESSAIGGGTFARRRAVLEARDREEARILKSSELVGKPDIAKVKDINELEKELSIDETKEG